MIQILLNILGSVLGVFKRLMCFLNIKRRRKTSGNILPMHTQVPAATDVTQSVPSNDLELESWDSWGHEDRGHANGPSHPGNHAKQGPHAHLYGRQASQEEEEEDVDFFSDMQPSFKKATKGSDLGTWEDSEGAWADEASEDLSWEAQATLREKRRLEREARQVQQQRKKQEREATKTQRGHNLHAVKLS